MTDTCRSSHPCPYYCCSDFNNFSEKNINTESSLKNRIHPTFRPSNVKGASKALSRNRALKLLHEPFQLASRFLAMDSVLLHVLTLAKGNLHLEKMNENPDKQILRRGKRARIQDLREDTILYYYPKPEHTFKNPNFQKDAKHILSQLANMVDFEISDSDNGCEVLQGPLPEYLRQEFPYGCRSLITIDRDMILDIASWEDAIATDDKIQFRMSQFELSQTLCHDLGHALTYAIYGTKSTSPAKNSAWFADAGYDLEAAIFGGIPAQRRVKTPAGPHNWEDEEEQDIWMLQEWPCDLICLEKMMQDDDGKRFDGFAYDPEPYSHVTVMPEKLILGVWREEFWMDKFRTNRFGTLRPVGAPAWMVALDYKDYERILKDYYRESDDDEEVVSDGDGDFDDDGEDSDDDEEGSDDNKGFNDDGSDDEEDSDDDEDSDDEEDRDDDFKLRMVEYNEKDLDEDAAIRLREIVRRQWLKKSWSDPVDILVGAAWLWEKDE